MTVRVALHHRTHYRYDRPVDLGPQVVRLRPAPHSRTPILSYSLKIEPKQHFLNWQQDPQSNYLARLVFPEKTREFLIEVDLVAEMTVINPFDFFLEPAAETYPFAYDEARTRELRPYLETEEPGPLLRERLAAVNRSEQATVDFLVEVNRRLNQEIRYIIRMEPGIQPCEETLGKRSGSCRDTAWLLVQMLRHCGLAARFVSGYLIQLVADEKPIEGPSGPAQDFTDLHAWAEVYLPGAGWVGLDPTSGLFAGEGHIPLACSADPAAAAPVTGAVGAANAELDFQMSVQRLPEDARVTKPYSEDAWSEIVGLGERVDAELRARDVRLTMGGEPTFVSIDDRNGEEWNFTALSLAKRKLAGDLLRRLRKRFAPNGVLRYGQGKWYPGEPLPRWTLDCYSRADGVPVWRDDACLADSERDYGFGVAEAERFALALADRLKAPRRHVIPAHEDPVHALLAEAELPINVDPSDSRLKDPLERARLAKIFDRGVGAIVGYVLPIMCFETADARAWKSGPWFFRRGHCFLVPGDSPIGLRLPLKSLPWVDPSEEPVVTPLDPTVPRDALSDGVADAVADAAAVVPDPGEGKPKPGESASWIVRTALCIDARDGRLNVFLPPAERLEDWLALVAAIEDAAAASRLPVIIEGYAPPHDPRLRHFSITPDPGVIEVNIQPASSWTELVETTTVVYDEARLARLAAEKFMLDGRHAGTGGGNHMVIGGATPDDSPILRRPDLLRSLLAYWNNHPSLSYLFSGLFIGPTSQAPRVDEARDDMLYELEIAFAQIPEPGAAEGKPWLADRLFRHLLVDVTGNTHRAEFCIDKLYSPDQASGRLGLVEMRGFEMPPHARMSLTQQLLLRALIARFWERPFRERLVRWGTQLHDRFMLPWFIARDLEDVLEELRVAGYAFRDEWFAPHLEFRFPKIGNVARRGIELELRQALEPWHVLGEEPAGGATSRFVDSSVERLQVRVAGLNPARHAVTCNGRRVPLSPTGVAGEYVAGVRYRAWQPPHALHPTIPVDTPLIFDIVDLAQGRTIGGCTYHVAHPGGRNYERFPVNAFEAEGRRAARFLPIGHTAGPMRIVEEPVAPEHPLTLDHRRGKAPFR